jgi:23S rRNA G2445 N2-methylase RlmL
MKPRSAVLEATPVIITTPTQHVAISRQTWRLAKHKALLKHTIAAYMAVFNLAAVCGFEATGQNDWPLGWATAWGIVSLIYALHGWRFADQKAARLIVQVVEQINATPKADTDEE